MRKSESAGRENELPFFGPLDLPCARVVVREGEVSQYEAASRAVGSIVVKTLNPADRVWHTDQGQRAVVPEGFVLVQILKTCPPPPDLGPFWTELHRMQAEQIAQVTQPDQL
jgi:hypothetical protein